MQGRHRFVVAAIVGGLTVGCAESIDMTTTPTQSAATIAIYSPDSAAPCNSVLPFPSDLSKNRTTGLLDLPFCPDDSADTIAIKYGLRTLDGYSIHGTMYTSFSGPVDDSNVTTAVKLMNGSTGEMVPVVGQWSDDLGRLSIMPQPGTVLDEASVYVVAITDDLKASDGSEIVSDQIFTFVKSTEPLIDEYGYSRFAALSDQDANGLEALRRGYQSVFAAFDGAGIPRERILVAWSFTTQTVHSGLDGLAALVGAMPATVTHQTTIPAAAHVFLADQVNNSTGAASPDNLADVTGLPIDKLSTVYTGTVTVTDLLTSSGTFGVDDTGAPMIRRTPIDYMLVTPKDGGSCTWNWGRVAVFAHGLGRCKNDVLALSNTLAGLCYATLSLDGPRAGARSIGNLGDQDVDGCPDQPAIPEIIALGAETPNPFGIRDRMRQWGLELAQVVSALEAGPEVFAGMTASADPTIALVGHSFGGMAAVHTASVSNGVDLLVTLASSGDFAAMFQPVLQAGIAAKLQLAGVDTSSAAGQALLAREVQSTVATYQWVLEPGDPLHSAPEIATALPSLAIAATQSAASVPDASFHDVATQRALGQALDQLLEYDLVCTTSGSNTAICDDDSGVVGSMLVPCADANLDALGKLSAMQTAVATFIATGSVASLTPDAITACQ